MRIWNMRIESIDLDPDNVEAVFKEHLNTLCGGKFTRIENGALLTWEDTGHGAGLTTTLVSKPSPVTLAAHALRAALDEVARVQHTTRPKFQAKPRTQAKPKRGS